MMPSPSCIAKVKCLSLLEKAEQIEDYIVELRRQRGALQLIDTWTSQYDYADFLETVSLIDVHIDLARKELRCVKEEIAQCAFSFS
jgi:hypothetical protein